MAGNCPYPGCAFSVPEGTDPVAVAALLNTHTLVHSQTARPKPTPVRRPEMSAGGTTNTWQYFLTRWRAYSTAIRLVDKDVSIQLLECLDPNLRCDVTHNAVGPTPIEEFTEANLLTAIRALAVRVENPKVARVTLSRMVQDRGEPVRSFAAHASVGRQRCVCSHISAPAVTESITRANRGSLINCALASLTLRSRKTSSRTQTRPCQWKRRFDLLRYGPRGRDLPSLSRPQHTQRLQ